MFHQSSAKLKIAGILTAAVSTVSMLSLIAQAATEQQLVGYRGDVNNDMTVNVTDAVLMAQHLNTQGALSCDLPHADLDDSQSVNAVDLTILKRRAIKGEEPDGIYEEVEVPEDNLIAPPIADVKPTLPSVGDTNILMFAVNFPDCVHSENYTTEQIWEMSFGPEDKSSSAYPLESISAYYTRSSYGRLNMQGDVFQYTTKNNIDSYIGNTDGLLEEIMSAFDSEIDYSKYDVNLDGTMDTVIVALPGAASGRDGNGDGSDDWWPCSGGYYGRKKYDNVKAGNLCIGAWALSDRSGFNSTWVHELGHAMGLPDYYKYENTQNGYYGLNGDAGWEMMDDAFGDMSAFSKLMYGWYTEKELQVYRGGTQTFTIQSNQYAPSCILIPRNNLDSYHEEYFIVELNTADMNNQYMFYENTPYPLFRQGGIRVLHCNAELWDGYWGPELKWNNYGQNYDSSNEKQRVLRLVNENNGFFRAGATISNSTSGFAWYDSNGDRTVNPGITITVDAINSDGTATVTITQN
ncbi:MAG: hypothetical protein IJ060_00820 [Oscillospiraceae bacterium]|nr:hypothetical protein [Oscillospiraceae bacterium]